MSKPTKAQIELLAAAREMCDRWPLSPDIRVSNKALCERFVRLLDAVRACEPSAR